MVAIFDTNFGSQHRLQEMSIQSGTQAPFVTFSESLGIKQKWLMTSRDFLKLFTDEISRDEERKFCGKFNQFEVRNLRFQSSGIFFHIFFQCKQKEQKKCFFNFSSNIFSTTKPQNFEQTTNALVSDLLSEFKSQRNFTIWLKTISSAIRQPKILSGAIKTSRRFHISLQSKPQF